MASLLDTPVDRLLANWWGRIDRAHKQAFAAAAIVSVLAFGFEMTNLTLHHDDLSHFMVQAPLVGYFLGRFVHAGLFYYVQGGRFLPFLDMSAGIVIMCVYGIVVAHFWGARKALDIALVAMILCVFPFMAQIYQYNSVMIAYPLAHLLAALAVMFSTRGAVVPVVVAALLYFVAFSIYQSVLANAATIFLVWVLAGVLFRDQAAPYPARSVVKGTAGAIAAVAAGGILHVLAVSSLDIPFDSAQGAKEAFSLGHRLEHGFGLVQGAGAVLAGTRSFLLWPEHYFPSVLKNAQLLVLAGAAIVCVWLPRGALAKAAALGLLVTATLAPRVLQFLHPNANYHNLTLTAYALVIAAAVMIVARSGSVAIRNGASVVALFLLVGYAVQCNWISTVNHLNTLAHYSTLTQVLSRVRAVPGANWDGKTVAVVGSYYMTSEFPFRMQTGVASRFLDAPHMNHLARLMREDVRFVPVDERSPQLASAASSLPTWPHPASVTVVDGIGLVALGKPQVRRATP